MNTSHFFFFFLSFLFFRQESIDHIHVISLDPPVRLDEKPPDYATVVDVPPPSYDDAIKLDPQRLLLLQATADTCAITVMPDGRECNKTPSSSNNSPAATVTAAADGDPVTAATTLAQAIRKSIRDIRKQLTNTVNDTAADVEQQQQQQGGPEQEAAAAAAAAPIVITTTIQKSDATARTTGAE